MFLPRRNGRQLAEQARYMGTVLPPDRAHSSAPLTYSKPTYVRPPTSPCTTPCAVSTRSTLMQQAHSAAPARYCACAMLKHTKSNALSSTTRLTPSSPSRNPPSR